jgi:probable rRNA maturation factor
VELPMSLAVDLQIATDLPGLPLLEQFESWVSAALAADGCAETVAVELTIRLVDETESADLNQHYRGRSGPTNVLSFPFELPPGIKAGDLGDLPVLLGDLVICAALVEREAAEQGKTPVAHWAHIVVHGLLHLRGHDHLDPADATRMETLETATLSGLGFPPPYD